VDLLAGLEQRVRGGLQWTRNSRDRAAEPDLRERIGVLVHLGTGSRCRWCGPPGRTCVVRRVPSHRRKVNTIRHGVSVQPNYVATPGERKSRVPGDDRQVAAGREVDGKSVSRDRQAGKGSTKTGNSKQAAISSLRPEQRKRAAAGASRAGRGPRPPSGTGMSDSQAPAGSAVVGSIMAWTRITRFAGKPPRLACSRTVSSSGAM